MDRVDLPPLDDQVVARRLEDLRLRPGPGQRPRLDLVALVLLQLVDVDRDALVPGQGSRQAAPEVDAHLGRGGSRLEPLHGQDGDRGVRAGQAGRGHEGQDLVELDGGEVGRLLHPLGVEEIEEGAHVAVQGGDLSGMLGAKAAE